MGGMAAQIPIKNDPAANEEALEKVRRRQAARSESRPRRHLGRASGTGSRREGDFRRVHEEPESDSRRLQAATCERCQRKDLLEVPQGEITEEGLRWNIDVGLQYLEFVAARQRLRARSTT